MTSPPACSPARLLACFLLLTVARLPAEDWPQFRGPTGQGISQEKNLPVEWGPDKNVKWKTPIPGLGWSSPVLADGRLYLTTAEKNGDVLSLDLMILDAGSGEVIQREQVFEIDAKKAGAVHSKNSYASPTPVVDGNRIYMHFGHLGTACYNTSGRPVWKTQEVSYSPVHGNGCSPVLVEGRLVFTADGGSDPKVIALDAENGNLAWKYNRPPVEGKRFAFATPLVIDVKGAKQIVAPGAGTVSGLRPAGGDEIWRVSYGDGYSVIPRPVYAHGLVFVSSGYDEAVALAIRPDGQGDVTKTNVAWERTKGAPHTPSMLVVGDELYLVSDGGVATCLDAKTGKQHWQQRIGGNFSASPVFADGKIYLQAEEGQGTVIAPGKKYKKLGENGFGERALASYAVGDGAIFVRTEKHLYRVQE